MLIYRAAAAGWTKRQSSSFFDPNEPTKIDGKRNDQRVEVLGAGQQFVAYGQHPDTRKPYEWVDMFGGLEYWKTTDLPIVTAAQLDDLLNEVDEILEAAVADGVGIEVEGSGQADGSGQPDDDQWLARLTPKLDLTPAQCSDALSCPGHENVRGSGKDYDHYLNVGMALHHQSDGAQWGLDTWITWGMQSAKFKKGDAERRWRSFGKNAKTLTFSWVLRNAGTLPPALAQIAYSELTDQTDTGNANLMHTLTGGDLVFCHEPKTFLFWDGETWNEDKSGSIAHRESLKVGAHYIQKAEQFKRQAEGSGLDKADQKRLQKIADSLATYAKTCRNKRALDAMLALYSHDPRVSKSATQFDCNPWVLGVGNGVVDLRTAELRKAARDEYVSKGSKIKYEPTARAPIWERFIDEITGSPIDAKTDPTTGAVVPASVGKFTPRPSLAIYLQKALGYSITGSASEQKMFIAVGAGSNGKNVLLDMVQEVLGDYWCTIPPAALMATRGDADAERPSPTVAGLAGARAAISNESRDGHKLDVQVVKTHTGGGIMTGRFLNKNPVSFEITHKLWLMTNHLPALDHLDEALRGRLHLIPFDRVWNRPGHTAHNPALPDGDKDLKSKLRSESAGILAWLVRGAVMYQREGLIPPEGVTAMTHGYFQEADGIGQWLEDYEHCNPDTGLFVQDLFNDYTWWCSRNDFADQRSVKSFSTGLTSRGVKKSARKEKGFLLGLRKTEIAKAAESYVSNLF
jgi:putative DNA primase/helicase